MLIATSTELNVIKDKREVLNVIQATDQVRNLPFGNTRKFQAVGLRRQDGRWQVKDSRDDKWYSRFVCEE